jgi:NADPH:quinone reductase-like Zn-dependent oxidoreductase
VLRYRAMVHGVSAPGLSARPYFQRYTEEQSICDRSFGAIRVGGKISMIGGLSDPATELNPGLIFARRANVQGISVGSMQMFEAMGRAIAASGIKPVLDNIFPFDEAQAAYRHMASGAHFGKIVIRVA